MASARDTRAGGAYVELSLRNHAFIKGLRGALGQLKAFGVSLQAVGAGVRTAGMHLSMLGAGLVTPLLLSAKAFADMGSALYDMSSRTGASVEALSEIGYAAKQTGAEIADVEIGIKKMQKAIAGASEGDKGPAKAIADLGLNLGELLQLSPDAQLEAIGDRITAIENPALQSAAAIEMFGRSGTKLLPMLADLGALRAEARRLGLTMSTEDAKAADTFGDSIDRLSASFKRIVVSVGAALAPALTEFADKLVEIAGSARKWIDENKGLIISLLKIGTAALAGGLLLTAFGGIISAIGTGFVVFATVAGAALSFLLSPIGATIAAITGIGLTVAWATGAAGDGLKWLGERFKELVKFASASFQGISDALQAGDIKLAADILWKSLKVIWQTALNTLSGWWNDFVDGLKTMWMDFKAWFFNSKFWTAFMTGISVATQGVYELMKIWQEWKRLESGDTLKEARAGFTIDYVREQAEQQKEEYRRGLFGTAGGGYANNPEEDSDFAKTISPEIMERYKNEMRIIDLQTAEAISQIGNKLNKETSPIVDFDKKIKNLDAAKAAALAAIADFEVQTPGNVAKANAEAKAKLAEANAKTATDLAEELAVAEGDLVVAIELAAQAKAARLSEGEPWAPGFARPGTPGAWEPPDPDELDKQIRKTIDVSGTFNAAAVSRMGVGDTAAEETAKNTKATADNTKKIWSKLGEKSFLPVA